MEQYMLDVRWLLRRRRYETGNYGLRVLGHKEIFCHSKQVVLTSSEVTQTALSNLSARWVSCCGLSKAANNRHRKV